MNDYISRDDVLKAIDYQHEVNNVFESEAAYVQMWETINDDMGIKAADVQPVKRGRWESPVSVGNGIKFCSVCRNEAYWDTDYGQQLFDYCPYCGAIMDGETE